MIFINPAKEADFEMEMWNADGTRSEMCGNGIRCVARYVYDFGLTDQKEFSIVSAGKVKYMTLYEQDGQISAVRVNMGQPILEADQIHPCFPNRTNTEFVQVIDRSRVRMRVWERGTGETLACGTGCCATAVACVLNGLTDNAITVEVLGGALQIEWDRDNDLVWMTGPATVVFSGEIEI